MRTPRSYSCVVVGFIVVASALACQAQSMCAPVSNNPLVMANLCIAVPPATRVPGSEKANPVQDTELHLTLTVGQMNAMVLRNAPAIQAGDNLLMEANRGDFDLEIHLSNGKVITTGPHTQNTVVGWRGGRVKLDYAGAINERIIRIKAIPLHDGGMPLLFRGIKFEREGRVILALDKHPSGPVQANEPPMSYPPDPMIPSPHISNVSITRPDLLGHQPATGFLAPKLPSYSMNPMTMQSTTTSSGDPNHYKFQGKELDEETGLYNFGARYYSSALGRYMSPDWSAKPAAVPFADLGNPQTLNLYSFGRNNPTSMRDSDGHCVGDDCNDVKVEVKVLEQPKVVQGEKQEDGSLRTGVRAKLQDTITVNGKALSHATVDEKNVNKVTLNGQPKNLKNDAGPAETNNAGQVNDTVGLLAPAGTPQEDAPLVNLLNNGAVTYTNENTLTFTTPGGETCSCSTTRTVTNVGPDGKASPNYTINPGKPVVKPAQQPQPQPKDKPQQ